MAQFVLKLILKLTLFSNFFLQKMEIESINEVALLF